MKKTRFFALLLVFSVLLTLVACGNSEAPSSENTENPAPTKTAPPVQTASPAGNEEPAEEDKDAFVLPITETPTYVTLWTPMNSTLTPYIDAIEENEAFIAAAELTNVYIESETISSTVARDQFSIMIASGDYCDLIAWVGNFYPGGVSAAVDDEICIELTDYIKEYCPNYMAVAKETGVMKDIVDDSGRMNGFAKINTNDSRYVIGAGLSIRQDYLEQVNMKSPTTYEELHDVLLAIYNATGAQLHVNPMGVTDLGELSAAYGISASHRTGNVPFSVHDGVVTFDWISDGWREYLSMMAEWYADGIVYSEFAYGAYNGVQFGKDDALSNLLAGEISCVQGACETFEVYENSAAEGQESMQWAPISAPVKKVGDKITTLSRPTLASIQWCMSVQCKEIETICRYVDYFFTEEGAALASYGVKGRTYNVSEDGAIVYTDLITKDPNNLSAQTVMGLYAFDDAPHYSDKNRFYYLYSDRLLEACAFWSKDRDNSSLIAGKGSAMGDESSRYSSYYGDIFTFVQEKVPNFIMGELDINDDAVWDEYVSKIEEMGAQPMTEIKQAQYDRYMKR